MPRASPHRRLSRLRIRQFQSRRRGIQPAVGCQQAMITGLNYKRRGARRPIAAENNWSWPKKQFNATLALALRDRRDVPNPGKKDLLQSRQHPNINWARRRFDARDKNRNAGRQAHRQLHPRPLRLSTNDSRRPKKQPGLRAAQTGRTPNNNSSKEAKGRNKDQKGKQGSEKTRTNQQKRTKIKTKKDQKDKTGPANSKNSGGSRIKKNSQG